MPPEINLWIEGIRSNISKGEIIRCLRKYNMGREKMSSMVSKRWKGRAFYPKSRNIGGKIRG